jgi:hypothetical protein
MSGKKETSSSQHNVEIQPFKLRRDAARLFIVYANLNDSKRQLLEDLLTKHTFLEDRTSPYRPWFLVGKTDDEPAARRATWDWLDENVSEETADAWMFWAIDISFYYPTSKSRRDAIVEFLGEVVRLKLLEESHPDDADELLKQADLRLGESFSL